MEEVNAEIARLNLTPLPEGSPGLPAPSPIMSRLDFLMRLTSTERIAARASTDPEFSDFMHLLAWAQNVDLTDPNLIAGIECAASLGIVQQGRVAEILAI